MTPWMVPLQRGKVAVHSQWFSTFTRTKGGGLQMHCTNKSLIYKSDMDRIGSKWIKFGTKVLVPGGLDLKSIKSKWLGIGKVQ